MTFAGLLSALMIGCTAKQSPTTAADSLSPTTSAPAPFSTDPLATDPLATDGDPFVVAQTALPSSTVPNQVAAASVNTKPFIVYEGAYAAGWSDYGWSPRKSGSGPIDVDMSSFGGVILGWVGGQVDLASKGPFVGVELSFAAPSLTGDFAVVRLGDGVKSPFPEIRVGWPDAEATGMRTVRVSFADLNPLNQQFDRIVIKASRELDQPTTVQIDHVKLLVGHP